MGSDWNVPEEMLMGAFVAALIWLISQTMGIEEAGDPDPPLPPNVDDALGKAIRAASLARSRKKSDQAVDKDTQKAFAEVLVMCTIWAATGGTAGVAEAILKMALAMATTAERYGQDPDSMQDTAGTTIFTVLPQLQQAKTMEEAIKILEGLEVDGIKDDKDILSKLEALLAGMEGKGGPSPVKSTTSSHAGHTQFMVVLQEPLSKLDTWVPMTRGLLNSGSPYRHRLVLACEEPNMYIGLRTWDIGEDKWIDPVTRRTELKLKRPIQDPLRIPHPHKPSKKYYVYRFDIPKPVELDTQMCFVSGADSSILFEEWPDVVTLQDDLTNHKLYMGISLLLS